MAHILAVHSLPSHYFYFTIFVPFVLIHHGFSIMSYSGVSFCIHANRYAHSLPANYVLRLIYQCKNAKIGDKDYTNVSALYLRQYFIYAGNIFVFLCLSIFMRKCLNKTEKINARSYGYLLVS